MKLFYNFAALKTMTYEIAILYRLFAFTASRAQFALSIICSNLFLISHRMRQIGERPWLQS